jgi:predicted nucleic acid-binding protein
VARVALRKFARTLGGVERIGLDTSALIYHLQDLIPYTALTMHLLTKAATGAAQLIISTVTVSEILAGPWRAGNKEGAKRIETALRALPGVSFAEITWEAASRGAELRGRTTLPLPDALIVASAIEHGAQLIVTNDAVWRFKRLPCRVAVLDDYLIPNDSLL